MPDGRKRRLRFRLPAFLRRVDREVEEEVRFHLKMRAAELTHVGLSPDAARVEAERQFGDVPDAMRELAMIDRRRLRVARRAEWWDGLLRDLRYALRTLRREPGFALAVIVTVGFGLGATSAMFGIVDRLLLQPPAYVVDPGQVGRIYYTEYFGWIGRAVTQQSTSYPDFVALRDHATSLRGVAAYYPGAASYGRGPAAQQVRRVAVSGEYFGVLGVVPQHGRLFGPEADALPSGEPVVVLGDAFWRRAFGAERSVLGRAMEIDGTDYTIVGIAPPDFTGLQLYAPDVWVPLSTVGAATIGDDWTGAAGWRWIRIVARLAPGYTRAQAGAEATALYRARLEASGEPDTTATVALGSVIAARGPNASGSGATEAQISLWLTGVAVLVLIIACANAANLLLARAVRRRREIGVRVALGAGRGRLMRQLLVESLVLAVLGGVVGLVLARWGGGLLRALLLPSVEWRENVLDPRLLAVAGALVIGVALATGLAPMMHAMSQHVTDNLKAGVREGGRPRARLRATLVLVQATLSVVLLIAAGLFVRSLRNVRGVELGFDANRVLLIDLRLGETEAGERDGLYRAARDRVATLPVVEQASVATTAPFWSSTSVHLEVPGLDSIPTSADGGPYVNAVTPEFFATVGTPIERGRGFGESDDHTAPRVAVVSETMARILWRGEDPLGKCLLVGADTVPCSTVVGVAHDARRQSLTDDVPVMLYYVPLDQDQVATGLRVLFVRTRGDDDMALAAVRREIQAVSPDLPYPTVAYLASQIEEEVRPWKLGATMFGLFGLLALALAALGLYSVVAYTVAQRLHEMGVRVALGARGLDVARLVLTDTLGLIGVGLALGVLAAVVAGRWVEPMLFQVSPHDPAVITGVVVTLLSVGTLASLVPARRAARVSPSEVLKAE